MSTIVTRAGKGSPLTHTEVDNNFTNLNTDKYQSGDSASFSSITNTGNLTFTGTGNRITGDFSNATVANRVSFQTSTTNGNTDINVLPNGTGTQSQFSVQNNSDPTNSGRFTFLITSSEATVRSNISGTGTYLPLTMYTGGSERLRIDTSGNVGIGSTSPSSKLQVTGTIHATGAGSFPSTSVSIEIVPAAAGGTNYIQAYNRTGSAWQNLEIGSAQTVFGTGGTERMRITSGGSLLIGTTDSGSGGTAARVRVSSDDNGVFSFATTANGWRYTSNALTNAGTFYHINFLENGTQRGSITSNGTNTAYNTTSDYRLKENISPMTGALAKVQALKPCTYTWKSTGRQSEGFIAHELQSVVPDCVTGEKDAIDKNGEPQYQMVDTSFLVATLTAAIQEQQAMIEELKQEVALLKSK